MKIKTNLVVELEEARNELEECIHQLITDQGWIYQTSEEDCCWRWYKKIGDITYCVDQDTALSFSEQSFVKSNPSMFEECE